MLPRLYWNSHFLQRGIGVTGKQKIQSAFSKTGADEIPVVICYENLFIRDHWQQLTSCPWWYAKEANIERQILWRNDVIPCIMQDWFNLPIGFATEDMENFEVEISPDGVFRFDKRTQQRERLEEPIIGGNLSHAEGKTTFAETPEGIDKHITIPANFNSADIKKDGRNDLAERLLNGIAANHSPIFHILSPLWQSTNIWGYEEFMLKLLDNPGLVKFACERYTLLNTYRIQEAAALGSEVIWIEECLLDLISPAAFREFNIPYMTRLVDTVRMAGLKSVYYYTGNPSDRMDLILSVGADAIAFEESKKNFKIDIEDIVEVVQGRCTVLGNLDATFFLPDCTEDDLKKEISRQIAVGRKNKSKFIMSIGSPVTPSTSVKKVRLYCDLAREIGKT